MSDQFSLLKRFRPIYKLADLVPKGEKALVENKTYKDSKLTPECFLFGLEEGYPGFVARVDKENSIVISFRGTDGLIDGISNLQVQCIPFEYGGRVHKGFKNAFDSIKHKLISGINKLTNNEKPKTFYIVGHSRGGAIATLAAAYIAREISPEEIQVVTFGSPRVGNETFKKEYEKLIKESKIKHTRYEEFLDLIPHLPTTASEKILYPRLGTIQENCSSLINMQIDNYCSVGERIIVDNYEDLSHNIPHEEKGGDSLNSFLAVERFFLGKDRLNNIKLINKIHTDYEYPIKK